MIVPVNSANIRDAAFVHAVSWQASHRAFCSPDFVALHTPERQQAYLQRKIDSGSRCYILYHPKPVGLVSVTGSLIEDLYILPDQQRKGFGTALLAFAVGQCGGTPTLWILENNRAAEAFYRKMGFEETGRRKRVADGLGEIEYALMTG